MGHVDAGKSTLLGHLLLLTGYTKLHSNLCVSSFVYFVCVCVFSAFEHCVSMDFFMPVSSRVSHKTLHKYEKESKQMGKSSFHFAWVLDQHEEERTRGTVPVV